MYQLWHNFFGTYTPITDPITGEALNSAAGINFEYIGMVALFIISFVWLLKFILHC